MKRKIACFISMMFLLSNVFFCRLYVVANEAYEGNRISEQENTDGEQIMASASGYAATIMQGNTECESDCLAFYNGLLDGGYSNFVTNGWTRNSYTSSTISSYRVTPTQFFNCKNNTVAYYSGHGIKRDGYPIINANAENSEIDVAGLLNVKNSTWRTDCEWTTTDPLRVLVLGACSQLDSSIMTYYARIMRASGIRAIAGYHEMADIHPTDQYVVEDFMYYCQTGNSIWYSWSTANATYDEPWAVLVYTENYNQYYRIPGFPGTTYTVPSSTAKIYRYADWLGSSNQEVLSVGAGDETSNINPLLTEHTSSHNQQLPLYITVSNDAALSQKIENMGIENREVVENNLDVADDSAVMAKLAVNLLADKDLTDVYGGMHEVVRGEVDPDIGYLEETEITVQRVYTYQNSYNGIKIDNAFIKFGVDCEGISFVIDQWKDVSAVSQMVSMNSISLANARAAVDTAGYDGFENVNGELVYKLIEDNSYKLCIKMESDNAIVYVDVETGNVMG